MRLDEFSCELPDTPCLFKAILENLQPLLRRKRSSAVFHRLHTLPQLGIANLPVLQSSDKLRLKKLEQVPYDNSLAATRRASDLEQRLFLFAGAAQVAKM